MRVGVSSLHLIGKPFNSLLEAIRSYGIDLWEIVDDDTLTLTDKTVGNLLDLRRSLGVEYTVHAPFADINIAAANEGFRIMATDRLKRSLRYARMIEARCWVFHPGMHSGLSFVYPQRDMEKCLLSVKELSGFAEKLGIPILIENMPNSIIFLLQQTGDFDQFYLLAGDVEPDMVMDIGHANTTKGIEKLFERQGNRIMHLHVHDNNGEADTHNKIGEGTVPWKVVTSQLTNLGFDKDVIVESVRDVPESIRAAQQLFLRGFNF